MNMSYSSLYDPMKSDAISTVITSGSGYLDIDAYACCIAMKELLHLQGEHAVVYSTAQTNYSVCDFLIRAGQIDRVLPQNLQADAVQYIIVDVSDPSYVQKDIPLDRIAAVYDHHTGFEEYWTKQIGDGAHIEFIGAAATLVFREWKMAGAQTHMTQNTALLLIAAILDNTLNLTSSNTTAEDIEAYRHLCVIAGVDDDWRGVYFSAVQKGIEKDLKNALLRDVKHIPPDMGLPEYIGQVAVWDAGAVLGRIDTVSEWFDSKWKQWMLNIIDIGHHRGYFVCNDPGSRDSIEQVFGLSFTDGIAALSQPYLRKQIIKKAREKNDD